MKQIIQFQAISIMRINRLRGGFSLIETLVAVVLSSIAILAFLNVVSNANRISQSASERFQKSMMIAFLTGRADDNLHGRSVYLSDFIREHYAVNDSDILASLESYDIGVQTMQKEYVDPLMMMNVPGVTAAHSFSVQQIRFEMNGDKKSCFSISSGTFQ